MARVVVGLDGSPQSLLALQHASTFAAAFEHEVVAIHVAETVAAETISPGSGRIRAAQDAARIHGTAKAALGTANARMRTIHLGVGERVGRALVQAAAEEGAAMLALGTSSSVRRWRRTLLGSTALDVLARDHLPLLLAGPATRPPVDAGGYRILFLSDDAVGAASLARLLHAAVAAAEATVTVLHVGVDGESSALDPFTFNHRVDRVRGLLSPNDTVTGRLEHVADRGDVLAKVLSVAVETRADALALATSSHRLKRRLWGGSTALSLLAHSPLPLIVVSRL